MMFMDNKRLAAITVLVLLLAGVTIGFFSMRNEKPHYPERSGLYGVFLANGQAYFGKITNEDGSFITLENVFYLQQNAENSAQGDVTLLKLGNEVHAPEDTMEINKSQVLFMERLKQDGKVYQAIESYQK